MAEPIDESQFELFSPLEEGSGVFKPRQGGGGSFFTRIKAHEKAVLVLMALFFTGIIAFSLGVEKGKRLSGFDAGTAIDAKQPGGFSKGYTIQVAVYLSKELAFKDAMLLKARGFEPQVFIKGNYILLCVGKFHNLESAQPLFSQLQKAYAGCRIRRL